MVFIHNIALQQAAGQKQTTFFICSDLDFWGHCGLDRNQLGSGRFCAAWTAGFLHSVTYSLISVALFSMYYIVSVQHAIKCKTWVSQELPAVLHLFS